MRAEIGRGAIVQRAVGQNFVAEEAQQQREIGQSFGKVVHRLPLLLDLHRRMQRNLAPLGSTIGQQQHIAQLGNLQRCAANARLVQDIGRIQQAGEIEASAHAQVAAQLFCELLLPLDPRAVARGGELRNAVLPQR